jgi:hypothetical protein
VEINSFEKTTLELTLNRAKEWIDAGKTFIWETNGFPAATATLAH